MIKFERVSVMNWENAIRGARNPMNSWEKSDSKYGCRHGFCDMGIDCPEWYECYGSGAEFIIGENDLALMMKLRNAGTDHRKFMRQIFVSVDITAPLYWWKEYDTYKVGTVANSTSTMHTIHKKPLSLDDFSHEHLTAMSREVLVSNINLMNLYAEEYKKTGDKEAWWQIIQLLHTSFNQKRTVTLNYEVLTNMYHARKAHKLDEWREFCQWIKELPYSQLITGDG